MGAPASHLKYQWIGLMAWVVMSTVLASRILGALDQPGSGWILGMAVLAAIFFSDLMSGTVHWAFDRYGKVDTPVLGPGFIKPFRDHHTDPQGICGHGFVETNGNNCIACIPLLVTGLWIDPVDGLFFAALILGTAIGVFGTNQFHSWAHEENPPRLARWLQRTGLVLDPEHHERHHTGEFDSYYCITNGWMNPIMEWLGVFPRFEAIFPPTVHTAETADTMTPHTTRGSHAPAPHRSAESPSGLHLRGK